MAKFSTSVINLAPFALFLALSCATLISEHVAVAAETIPTLASNRRVLNYVYSYSGRSHGSSTTPSSGGYGPTSSPSFGGSYGSSPSNGGGCSHGSSSTQSSNIDSAYGSSGGSYGSSTPFSTSYGYGYSSQASGGSYGGGYGKGTPRYWLGHTESVPTYLSVMSKIVNIFGPRVLDGIRGVEDMNIGPSISELTIFGALDHESRDPLTSLVREGSAAYINSFAYANEYPLAPSAVVSRFNNALDSPETSSRQAIQFQEFNENV